MGIADWQIVLEAIIAVGMVGYGIWLKYIIDQQLKTKDAAMQALEAALKSKDAEISRLQGESAPAIAAKYKTMKEFADQMTEESQRLEEKLSEHQRGNRLSPLRQLHAEGVGMLYAIQLIQETLSSFHGREFEPSELIDAFITTTRRLLDELGSKYTKLNLMLEAEESR